MTNVLFFSNSYKKLIYLKSAFVLESLCVYLVHYLPSFVFKHKKQSKHLVFCIEHSCFVKLLLKNFTSYKSFLCIEILKAIKI